MLNPTFVTFTPWTTLQGYVDLLNVIIDLDLIDNISPIQYAIRLLIPVGSRLLQLEEVQAVIEEFDEDRLCFPWTHPDPRVDRLYEAVMEIIKACQYRNESRQEIFKRVWELACDACALSAQKQWGIARLHSTSHKVIPYLSEPWFC